MKITRTTDYELIAHLNKPIHELHVSLYPQYFTEYNYEAIRDSFKKLVQNEDCIFLQLEDKCETIGYAWIEIRNYPKTAFKKAYKSIYVHQISVGVEYKNQGYGSQLMSHIYRIAESEGIDLVELDYWANNEHAKNFYNKQGFSSYREFVYKKL
jgi:diamine N-acetyltransferase